MRGHRRAPDRETEWLREDYAEGRISLEELEEEVERALAWGNPPRRSFVPAPSQPRRPALRPAFVVVLVAVALGALAAVARGPESFVGGPTRAERNWATLADGVCADMVEAYRAEVRIAPPDPTQPPSSSIPLERLAAIRRAGVAVEQTALERLQALGEAPSRDGLAALSAFEDKIGLEARAVAAAERGRRGAFELAMRQSVDSALAARHSFARTGSSVCSNLM